MLFGPSAVMDGRSGAAVLLRRVQVGESRAPRMPGDLFLELGRSEDQPVIGQVDAATD